MIMVGGWACGGDAIGGTDTRLSVNTTALEVSLQAIDFVLGSDNWFSLRDMGSRIGAGTGLPEPPPGAGASAAVLDASLPGELLGRTLTLDSDGTGYVVDPQRSDAPEDGLRIVLLDSGAAEVGFVEFRDAGSSVPGQSAMNVVASMGDQVYLSVISDAVTGSPLQLFRTSGSSSLSSVSLELDYEARPTSDPDMNDVVFQLRLSEQDFEAVVNAPDSPHGAPGSAWSLEVRNLGDLIDMAVDLDGENLTGTVAINGRSVGTLAGSTGNPQVVRSPQSEATAAQAALAQRLLVLSLGLFPLYADLVNAPLALITRAASGP